MAFNMKEGQSVWINGKLANFDGDDGAWRVLVPNCYQRFRINNFLKHLIGAALQRERKVRG